MLPDRHPDFSAISAELHSRPPPELESPAVIVHLALLSDGHASGLQQSMLALGQAHQIACQAGERHCLLDLGPVRIRWERHTEFDSLLVIRPGDSADCPLQALPDDWLANLPGKLVSAARVELVNSEADLAGARDEPYVGGEVAGGRAQLRTNFREDNEGFVTFQLLDQGLDEKSCGRLVQRIMEIETYRMMALLGLPRAKVVNPELNRLESRLAGLVSALGQLSDLSADQAQLEELFSLARQSEQLLTDSAFRFSATRAYGRIVADRLVDLGEQRLDKNQLLAEFLERRFEPALRTCAATAERQENLSRRIARTADLVRTRVDVALQDQNRRLLANMDRRARQQLRLQQTVEGLSVMAISYYSLGILTYVLGGWIDTSQVKLLTSLIAPLLLGFIWFLLRQRRRKATDDLSI